MLSFHRGTQQVCGRVRVKHQVRKPNTTTGTRSQKSRFSRTHLLFLMSYPYLYLPLKRQLFAEAEDEQKKMGINSALHIIIFDELDAICKQRGSVVREEGVIREKREREWL